MQEHPLRVKIKSLVGQERKIQVAILETLQEIYEKRLHLEWKHSTLFAFATDELGYSPGSAHRRIEALKLTQIAPEVKEKISNGSLTVTSAAQVHLTLKQLGKPEAAQVLIVAAENKSTRNAEKALVETARQFDPEFGEESLVSLRITEEAEAMMEKLRAHFSHLRLNDSEIIIRLGEKELGEKPTPAPAPAPDSKNPRYISAQTRRFIRQRDKTCTYTNQGQRCNSTHFLEIDHMRPVAHGGTSAPENLRLLCRAHNQLAAHHAGIALRR